MSETRTLKETLESAALFAKELESPALHTMMLVAIRRAAYVAGEIDEIACHAILRDAGLEP